VVTERGAEGCRHAPCFSVYDMYYCVYLTHTSCPLERIDTTEYSLSLSTVRLCVILTTHRTPSILFSCSRSASSPPFSPHRPPLRRWPCCFPYSCVALLFHSPFIPLHIPRPHHLSALSLTLGLTAACFSCACSLFCFHPSLILTQPAIGHLTSCTCIHPFSSTAFPFFINNS
jgi:hypothetical protein